VYRAFLTRASENDQNNEPLINQILSLRHSKAQILGYESHAHVSLAAKMASLTTANELLDDLHGASYRSDNLNNPDNPLLYTSCYPIR